MKTEGMYIPTHKVSEETVNLIAEISAAVERFDIETSCWSVSFRQSRSKGENAKMSV